MLQERRQQRLANSIRSAHAISSQASVYIPVVSNPDNHPPYLSMEYSSKWHTSALQAAIVESISLPSRLRSTASSRSLLADMEQIFIATSIYRKILQAEMSVNNKEESHVNGVTDDAHHDEEHDLVHEDTRGNTQNDSSSALDMSFFPNTTTQRASSSQSHLFSRLNVTRGQNVRSDSI